MTRAEAIELLAQRELKTLTPDDRESRLLDCRDEEDDVGVPDDALLLQSLRHEYVGVLNEFIEQRLGISERVIGQVEVLRPCDCCGFRTIETEFDVCPVCFWEECSVLAGTSFPGPNRLPLQQARQNFERIGAMSEGSLKFVLVDGPQRYAK